MGDILGIGVTHYPPLLSRTETNCRLPTADSESVKPPNKRLWKVTKLLSEHLYTCSLAILDLFLKEVAREGMMDFCRGKLGGFERPRQEDWRNRLRKDRRC